MKRNVRDIERLNRMAMDDSRGILAFEEIYNCYSKNLFIYAMNVCKKKDVCEDVVQNVFIDFWARRNNVKIKNVRSYLFQAVKYQIFNHIRNQKISNEDLTRLNIIDLSMNISRKMEFDELQQLVDQQVHKLPSRCQQIFVLSRYQHKSNKEIAKELGISIQAVKNQISKALASLRRNLISEEVIFYFVLLNIF